eukprot:133887-Rhodomonas_salina.2
MFTYHACRAAPFKMLVVCAWLAAACAISPLQFSDQMKSECLPGPLRGGGPAAHAVRRRSNPPLCTLIGPGTMMSGLHAGVLPPTLHFYNHALWLLSLPSMWTAA